MVHIAWFWCFVVIVIILVDMLDPSSVFKDAVDGLLQHALTAQNHLSVYPWGDDALLCHVILNWQLQPCTTNCWIKKKWRFLQIFKGAVDGPLKPIFLQNYEYNFFWNDDVSLKGYAKAQEMVQPKIFLEFGIRTNDDYQYLRYGKQISADNIRSNSKLSVYSLEA